MGEELKRVSSEEIQAEAATMLPDKEVLSLLDLGVDLDLALDLAAPIDLAIAANANIAAPISAAVGANVLSFGSEAAAVAEQGAIIDQNVTGEAIANAPQTSVIDQSDDVVGDGTTEPLADASSTDGSIEGVTDEVTDVTDGSLGEVGSMLDGNLLNVDVDASLDADLAAPVAGAVAANANVAAPINASVAANVASIDSSAVSVANQDAVINQNLDDVVAEATADQDSTLEQ